ncbi:hypothetical protein B296_00032337 [Ensete ventricosum]|uniref:Uncharacterized protein n=1 Tax=Ensete ventricosum TaxID=4639 RepID=A0A426Y8Z4_ENSVE|nr:hypothetical protein B296_00032337 [Ensete ventricosum]
MEKHPREVDEPRISFEAGEAKYPDHDDALEILVHVANALVKRVMVDTSNSSDILYQNAIQKLELTTTDLSLMSSTLIDLLGTPLSL